MFGVHPWQAAAAGQPAERSPSPSRSLRSRPRVPLPAAEHRRQPGLLLSAHLWVYGTSPENVQRMKTDLDVQVKNKPALFRAEGEVSQARCHQPGSTGVPGVPVTSCGGGTGTSQPLPGKTKPRARSTSGMQGPNRYQLCFQITAPASAAVPSPACVSH